MAEMRSIPDDTYREAGDILRAVSGRGPRPEFEAIPGIEAVVAGAALALERNMPNLLYNARSSTAEDWLTEGVNEWRHMHGATARAIDMHRSGEADLRRPQDAMTHIVADVVNQGRARRTEGAIRNSHPVFMQHLDADQIATVADARRDPRVVEEVAYEGYGNYARLSPTMQRWRAESFATGSNLPPEMKDDIATLAGAIEHDRARLGHHNRETDRMLSDFREIGTPLFREASREHAEHAARIADGSEPVRTPLDAGMAAHARSMAAFPVRQRDDMATTARTQAAADMEGGSTSADQVAIRIEAHRLAVLDARGQGTRRSAPSAFTEQEADEIAWGRSPTEMPPKAQEALFRTIRNAEFVTPLAAMKLTASARAIENETSAPLKAPTISTHAATMQAMHQQAQRSR